MAEGMTGLSSSGVDERNKDSSTPPQDDPANLAPSGSPLSEDAEAKVKKSRNTIILREVDPAATEEQILALFTNTDLKVVSAKPDVQNTWFVQLETEEQAKSAISHVSNQELCGKPVKARVKSETVGLRTTAPAWQPSSLPGRPTPMYMLPNSSFTGAAPGGFQAPTQASSAPPGVVLFPGSGWSGAKSSSGQRPTNSGAFKQTTTSSGDAEASAEAGQASSNAAQQALSGAERGNASQSQAASRRDQAPREGRGKSSGSQSGSGGRSGNGSNERRAGGGRKPAGHTSPTPTKPVAFQPQDFPTLGGQALTSANESGAQTQGSQAQGAPAHSWAAIAKTVPDVAPPKKKDSAGAVAEAQPKASKESAPQVEQPAISAPAAVPVTAVVNAPAPAKASASEMVKPESAKQSTPLTKEQEQAAAEQKRRGWEKPGLPQLKKATPPSSSPSPTTDAPAASTGAQSATSAPVTSPQTASGNNERSKKSSGKKGGSKEKEERQVNGNHAPNPPIQPPAWGTKSFAQVIKEKPVASAPATHPASSASATSTSLSALPAKTTENWGDVEEDEPASTAAPLRAGNAPATAASLSMGAAAQKIAPSSDNTDWRRDAAARRKIEEQTRTTQVPARGKNEASS